MPRLYQTVLLIGVVLHSACGGGSGSCPAGLEKRDGRCQPIFDDCNGPAEIPVLGGGCQPVGVPACAAGFEPDPVDVGACTPILPASDCPAGTMPRLGETTCVPVGVTACRPGFQSDGAGGCEAIVADTCPPGEIAVLGEPNCQPITDCGSASWGNIVTDPQTVFVDASFGGPSPDGTQGAPYPTIGEALIVVADGGQIALAAGIYPESLTLARPVRITGRCPAQVTISGRTVLGQSIAPITIDAGGSGSEIAGVTLTGGAEGVLSSGASGLRFTDLEVRDTGGLGLAVFEGAAELVRVRVSGATRVGVYSEGTALVIRDSAVEDTLNPAALEGQGIRSSCGVASCGSLTVDRTVVRRNVSQGLLSEVDTVISDTLIAENLSTADDFVGEGIRGLCTPNSCAHIEVVGSVLEGNHDTAITLEGAHLVLDETTIRETVPTASGLEGAGIYLYCAGAGLCGSVDLRSSVLTGNRAFGATIYGGDLTVTRSIVADTAARLSGDDLGWGLQGACDDSLRVCGTMRVTDSLVEGNTGIGLIVDGPDATIEGVVSRGTQPRPSDLTLGRGMHVQCGEDVLVDACGQVAIDGVVIEENHDVGLLQVAIPTTVDRTLIRDTREEIGSGYGGRAIGAECDPTAPPCEPITIVGSVIQNNWEAGLLTAGVDMTVERTTVTDTLPLALGWGYGATGQCYDPGRCGSLTIRESYLAGNASSSITLHGVPARFERVLIADTVPSVLETGLGHGVGIDCVDRCATLEMTGCLVRGSSSAGISVSGTSGFIAGTAVRGVTADPVTGEFGIGVQVAGRGMGDVIVDLVSSVIFDAALVGVFYDGAVGLVNGNRIAGGDFTVAVGSGPSPTLTEANSLSGNLQDELLPAGLSPAPAPPPSIPLQP